MFLAPCSAVVSPLLPFLPVYADGVFELVWIVPLLFGPWIVAIVFLLLALRGGCPERTRKVYFVVVIAFVLLGVYTYWQGGAVPRATNRIWAEQIADDAESIYAPTGLSDAQLKMLRKTTRLKQLNLGYGLQRGEQLQHVGGFGQLRSLSLQGNARLHDIDLRYIEGLTQLQELSLSGCWEITNAGLVHLEKLKQLQQLDLRGTEISDGAVNSLKSLTNLKQLRIGNTQVTDDGMRKLREVLPNCTVSRDKD
jgi:hypothetical protein